MRRRWVASLFLVAVFASACGGSGSDSSKATPAGSDGGASNATSADDNNSEDASDEGGELVTITDSGFGQAEYSTQAMVIATNDSDAAIGEFVTVSVNFLDKAGQILATAEQIETFNWVGQELALPVSPYDLDDKAKVASIDPSVSLSEYGGGQEAMAPLPVLDSTEVKKGEYGGYTASFAFTNETDADLKNLRVGVVCYDAASKIIGGTSTYPELAPAGKTIRIDADPVVSTKPDSCKAYLNYDV